MGNLRLVPPKQPITNVEIERDIRHALKNPPEDTEERYRRKPLIIIPILPLAVTLVILWPIFSVVVTILLFISMPFMPWLWNWYLDHKRISVNDYQITAETVDCVIVKSYTYRRHKHYYTVYNHFVRFENGKTWTIPADNYAWTQKHRMDCSKVLEATHRGDIMIVVTNKRNGKIVMAYNTDTFQYVD